MGTMNAYTTDQNSNKKISGERKVYCNLNIRSCGLSLSI